MCDNLLCNWIYCKTFAGSSICGWASLSANWWEGQFAVEKFLKIGRAAPVEGWETDPVEDDPNKLRFNALHSFVIGINDLRFAGLIDEDSSAAHFEGGGLKRAGEGVGGAGDVVELGEHGIEAVAGDATIQSIVDHLLFESGVGGGVSEMGVDDFHSGKSNQPKASGSSYPSGVS